MKKLFAIGIGLLAYLTCLTSQGLAQASYTIFDLGTLGGNYSAAGDINDNSLIVGVASTATNADHSFWYSYRMWDLYSAGVSAAAINASGEIAGSDAKGHASVYNIVTGATTDLGTLPGGSSSSGAGINAAGHVTGWSYTNTSGSSQMRAFLYSNGTMKDLGTNPGPSLALGINDSDQITGREQTTTGGDFYHAFLYNAGTVTDLGTLKDVKGYSYGYGINSSGHVTGYSQGPGVVDAFLYSGGKMIDLGVLHGDTNSGGLAINDYDQVVGYSNSNGSLRAFLYTHDQGMVDLNTLIVPSGTGWNLSQANAINNLGQIVGRGTPGRNEDVR